ncbi:MAG: glycosyltransferase [Candidatus Micrarchaeaceae archaeon]
MVLPTLNEEQTIGKLIDLVEKSYKGIKIRVMDDGSEDKTQEIVKLKMKNYTNIELVNRKKLGRKKGLTASIIDGILGAKTEYVIVIDADLQHPIYLIRKIAKEMEKEDIVVGYRKKVTEWAFHRKVVSFVFQICGKLVLFIRRGAYCKDIMSGAFGIRKDFFAKIYEKNKEKFVLEGYKVLFDILKCMERKKVKDVPYVFESRKGGRSKAGYRQAICLIKSFLN